MEQKTLPKIEKKVLEKEIENARDKGEPYAFFHIFVDRYNEIIQKDKTGKIWYEFTDEQHILMSILALNEQVGNGGFIQFIFNGYGFIFEMMPFSEFLKSWGAEKTAEIANEVKPIYKKYEKEFKKAKTLKDLSKLYSKMPEFKTLDEKYYIIEDEEAKIKKYVEENVDKFAIII
jgi:hypothetical protein